MLGDGANNGEGGTSGPCVPKTCAQLGYTCGPNSDGCDNVIQCGTCTAPEFCGAGGYSKCGGNTTVLEGGSGCTPRTCAELGFNCGPAGDGCGGLIPSCGACNGVQICGGGGKASVCGDDVDGGCTNLCLQQVACSNGGTTTITGTVYAPTPPAYLPPGGSPDPLYDALVYVPNAPVQAFAPGLTCDVCGAQASGDPLVSFTTGPTGKFTLTNAPCGTNIPLVIQLGRWRRQITIPSVACCQDNALTPDETRLPRTSAEGDIPFMAIVTGYIDPIECILPKIGIDVSEFTNPGGGGRVELYKADSAGGGAVIDANTPLSSALYNSPAALNAHDLVIFDCEAAEYDKSATAQANVIDYANAGGRVFASHFSYVWLFDDAPFSSTAAWQVDQTPYPPNPLTADINTSFQKGMDFSTWLGNLNPSALLGPNTILVQEPRHDTNSVNVPPSQLFLTADPATSPNNPLEFTFNTPIMPDAGPQCGRVLFSDFHVSTSGTGMGTFPTECPIAPMTPQEKVLEFMLFDLTSCIQQTTPPPPPTCTPMTCAAQHIECGPADDGCGNLIECGPCTAPAQCGAGNHFGQCSNPDGGYCIPKTCKEQSTECGPIGDGCGHLLNCGKCDPPQTCGGGGHPGNCGGGGNQ